MMLVADPLRVMEVGLMVELAVELLVVMGRVVVTGVVGEADCSSFWGAGLFCLCTAGESSSVSVEL